MTGPSSDNPEPKADPHRIHGKLLIVDDSEYDRLYLSKCMTARGHEITAVESGEAALELLDKEHFDLLLLDSRLPTFDGLEILAIIRQRTSRLRLPIIMVTGWDRSEAMVEALRLGANDYVTKPVDPDVVEARVQTQLSLLTLMRQREEFLAFASHDLKNPLTVIIGYAGVADMQLTTCSDVVAGELRTTFERIKSNAQYMTEIVNDFVDFHALQEGRLRLDRKALDVPELIDSVANSNRSLAERKEIALEVSLESPLPRMLGDRTRIAQVLNNLVSNAIKFCDSGCHVVIHAQPKEGGFVSIAVEDDGPGLTQEDMGSVFKKFAKLSARPTAGEKSSGLGLTICKRLVELHGGELNVRNNTVRGATFWFTVPAAE